MKKSTKFIWIRKNRKFIWMRKNRKQKWSKKFFFNFQRWIPWILGGWTWCSSSTKKSYEQKVMDHWIVGPLNRWDPFPPVPALCTLILLLLIFFSLIICLFVVCCLSDDALQWRSNSLTWSEISLLLLTQMSYLSQQNFNKQNPDTNNVDEMTKFLSHNSTRNTPNTVAANCT